MEHTKVMDVFAYYLSEYDMNAFHALGFDTQKAGFDMIAALYGKKSSYLRRLRDEFDVVTNSTRKGQRNRAPRIRIEQIASYLEKFSFEELTDIAKAFLENVKYEGVEDNQKDLNLDKAELSEEELERILNAKDPEAAISIKVGISKTRIYKTDIIRQLKKLYKGHCQLCGTIPLQKFGIDICEAHHIDYFASSYNNDASNIIIICPNHHRIIHKLNPIFNAEGRYFEFPDGTREEIKIDFLG